MLIHQGWFTALYTQHLLDSQSLEFEICIFPREAIPSHLAYYEYLVNIAQCNVHLMDWLRFTCRQLPSNVLGHVVLMHIKWVAMATGDKNANHGTLLLLAFVTSFMLCKYYLHTADNSSRLSIFAKKVGF